MLADVIRDSASERGLGNQDIAQATGMSEGAIGSILQGDAIPTLPELFQLARALGEPISTLIEQRNDDIDAGLSIAHFPGPQSQLTSDLQATSAILSLATSLHQAAFNKLQESNSVRAAEAARQLGNIPEPTDPYSAPWDALMIDAAGALGVAAALANDPEVRLESILSLASHNGHSSEILACREATTGTDASRLVALELVMAHDQDLGVEIALRALDHPRTPEVLQDKAFDLLLATYPDVFDRASSLQDFVQQIGYEHQNRTRISANELNSREVAEALAPLVESKSLSSVHPQEWVKIHASAPDICQVLLTGFTAHPDPHEREAAYNLMRHTEILNQRALVARGMNDEDPRVQQAARAVQDTYKSG